MTTLRSEVRRLAIAGKKAVWELLADEGLRFHKEMSELLYQVFKTPMDLNLFLKCVIRSCQWAGFVGEDPDFYSDACRFFETGIRPPRRRYTPGFHRADPIANLTTWQTIVDDPKPLVLPTKTTTGAQLITFEQDALAALKLAKWRKEAPWVGAWTFHGAFKIYLIYRNDLWDDDDIDVITLPTGGKADGGSFEGGWSFLNDLGLVRPLPPQVADVDDALRRSKQVHAKVVKAANDAKVRALHLNSGIYLLGSE